MQPASPLSLQEPEAVLHVLPADQRHPSPYPGFRSFDFDDADLFFGRKSQIDQLLTMLESRFVAVLGPSGCGKSSLVRAGLLPGLALSFRLKSANRWRIAQMRPGNSPMTRLAEALLSQEALGREWGADSSALGFLSATLRRGSLGLVEAVREAGLPDRTGLVLLVDQFEELFRYGQGGGKDEGQTFAALLASTVDNRDVPIHVVITMRSDFLGACTRFPGLAELISQGMFLTPRLTREQCSEAIVTPARLFGGSVEPALVNQLLNDIGGMLDPLPPLQHVLMRVWSLASLPDETGKKPDHMHLNAKHYRDVGALEQALSRHANEAFDELGEGDRRVAEVLFRGLVDVGPDGQKLRQSIAVGTVADRAGVDIESVERVVARFMQEGRSFLVRSGGKAPDREAVVDIPHESLIRLWDRLVAWSDDEARWLRARRLLREATKQWLESGRDPQYLFRGRRLRDIGELAVRYGNMDDTERDFETASMHAVMNLGVDGAAQKKKKPVGKFLWELLTGQSILFELAARALIRLRSGELPIVRQPLLVDDAYPYDACLLHTASDARAAVRVEKFLDSFHEAAALEADLSLRKLRIWPLDFAELDDPTFEQLTDARHLLLACSREASNAPNVERAVRTFLSKRPRTAIAAILLDGEPARIPEGVLPPVTFQRTGAGPAVYDLRAWRDRRHRKTDPDKQLVGIAARLNGGITPEAAQQYWFLSRIHRFLHILIRYVLPATGCLIVLFIVLRTEARVNEAEITRLNATITKSKAAEEAAKERQRAIDALRAAESDAASLGKDGKTDGAIELYRQALQRALQLNLPEDANTINASLGNLYYSSRDYLRAIRTYTDAINGGLQSSTAYYERGRSHAARNQFDEAFQDFSSCLALDPGNSRALLQRAIALRQLGNFKPAVDDLLKAVSAADSPKEQRTVTEDVRTLLLEIKRVAPPSFASLAADAMNGLKPIPRYYLHHSDSNSAQAACVSQELTKAAFVVRGLDPGVRDSQWVINYYFVNDEDTAKDIAAELVNASAKCGLSPFKPQMKLTPSNFFSPGMFAIWMPKIALGMGAGLTE